MKLSLSFYRRFSQLSIFLQLLLFMQTPVSAFANDIKSKVPELDGINSLASKKVSSDYIDSLKRAADFEDYKISCTLLTEKEDRWKQFGGADLFYKRHDLLRAVIKSGDYRNGSVVVKQADGKIKGRGGGLLRSMKMTIEPDSRTIKLPTGYSLAASDFQSLYDSMKISIASGKVASTTTNAVTVRQLSSPVQVLLLKTGATPDSQILEAIFLDPQSKLPIAWNTYKDGKLHAVVLFDGLVINKGLADDLFQI